MTRRLKFFLIALFLSLPVWWGIERKLEDFFFWLQIAQNPPSSVATINPELIQKEIKKFKPIRNWQIEDLNIEATSAIAVEIDDKSTQKVLFKKASSEVLPIASISKLMTALVVLENYEPSQIVEISKTAVSIEGESGKLKIGEIFKTQDLLYPLLMESSNDVAQALSEVRGEQAFVDLMNFKAENLGLKNTNFVNPTGLDPETSGPLNSSTAEDLIRLTDYLLKTQPLIWKILTTSEFDLYSADGVYHHKVLNNNKLLKDWPERIVGAKTGYTDKASGCIILVLKNPNSENFLINAILGSVDRYEEMKKLVNWLDQAYIW
jgi:D-alanyl-D-alanine carboxypeptidase (penicillin-binding protein 5/6)